MTPVIAAAPTTGKPPPDVELPLLGAYYRRLPSRGLKVFAITTEGSVLLYRMEALFAATTIPAVRRVKGMPDEMPAVPITSMIAHAGIVRYAKARVPKLDDLTRETIPFIDAAPPA